MSKRELQLMEIVLPGQSNHYGTLFGPNAMALLGRAAFLGATRFCGQSVVMAAVRQIEFLAPIPVGALLDIRTCVTRVGRTSLSINVLAALTKPAPEIPDVLRGEFVMVAVDENGNPIPVIEAGDIDGTSSISASYHIA